jgi:hypothetical protein
LRLSYNLSHSRFRKLSDYELSFLCKPLIINQNCRKKIRDVYHNNGSDLHFPINLRPSLKSCFCLMLLRSGDIQLNPGPTLCKPKYPCPVCNKGVIASSKAAVCEKCVQKTHVRCLNSPSTMPVNPLNKNQFISTCEKCLCKPQDENAVICIRICFNG